MYSDFDGDLYFMQNGVPWITVRSHDTMVDFYPTTTALEGQPALLCGSNDGNTISFYNPSNFNVSSANKINSLGQQNETDSLANIKIGLSMTEAYKNGYPTAYGNIINLKGKDNLGAGQLFCGWSDKMTETVTENESLYYRSKRDVVEKWSNWDRLAFMKDVTAANTGGIVAQSLGANGYVKFANGLILQWGNYLIEPGYNTIELAISFTTTYSVSCASQDDDIVFSAKRITSSSILVKHSQTTGHYTVFCIMLGY